jgi:hypothetical protein
MLARIAYFATFEGLDINNANAIHITEEPFYFCACCYSHSGDAPFAILPTSITVRWGDVGITYSHFNGQYIFRHFMYTDEPRMGSWLMDASLSSHSEALRLFETIPEETHRELIGEYPLYTPDEAAQRLLDGRYFTTIRSTAPTTEEPKQIAHVELVYLTYQQRIFMPFFRFYIEMPPEFRRANMQRNEQYFGIYYVTAVRDEFFFTP